MLPQDSVGLTRNASRSEELQPLRETHRSLSSRHCIPQDFSKSQWLFSFFFVLFLFFPDGPFIKLSVRSSEDKCRVDKCPVLTQHFGT